MTWSSFWLQSHEIILFFKSMFDTFPPMIVTLIFAPVSFAALWVLVRMVREVRS